MNLMLLSHLSGYKTYLPFNACALERMPLNQPTGEELLTIANVGKFSIQIRKTGAIYTLDKWLERNNKLSPLAAVVKNILQDGSSCYDLSTYEKIAVAKLYDDKYNRVQRFLQRKKYKAECQWIKNWLIFIFESSLKISFQQYNAYCCILNNETGEYLKFVSYYRHYTTMKDVMETSVVAEGVQVFFIKRTVF